MRFRIEGGGRDPSDLEGKVGYQFTDPTLLERALTHKSFSQEHPECGGNNQRLEFLGDAVLGLVIATELLHRLPEGNEGSLSRLRASLVRGGSLARIGRRLEVGTYLRLGNGEETSGGRDKDKLIEDAVESIIGALYSDAGYQVCRRLVLSLFEEDLFSVVAGGMDEAVDYKSKLQELLQRGGAPTPEYAIVRTWGPDHQRSFECEVRWKSRVLGIGQGSSKKAAEKDAAFRALGALVETAPELELGP